VEMTGKGLSWRQENTPTFCSLSSAFTIVLSLWLWLGLEVKLVCVTVQGVPGAADWEPKQQKNDDNMFRLLGFFEIEAGTEIVRKKLVRLGKNFARISTSLVDLKLVVNSFIKIKTL